MTDAPEKIWVEHHGPNGTLGDGDGEVSLNQPSGQVPATEYIRADIAQAEIERLREALRKIADDLVPVTDGYERDKCAHRRTMDQDCKWCTMAFARAALEGEP